MSTTISRLYNSYGDARAAVQQLELAGVADNDISIIASNADNWYNNGKDTFPDRDLNGKDDRAEATGTGAAIGAAAGGAVGLLTGTRSDIGVQANVSFQVNCGSRWRALERSKMMLRTAVLRRRLPIRIAEGRG